MLNNYHNHYESKFIQHQTVPLDNSFGKEKRKGSYNLFISIKFDFDICLSTLHIKGDFFVDLRVYSEISITTVWNNTFIIVPYTLMPYFFGWKLIILFLYIYKTVIWLNSNVNLTFYAKTESISLLALGERFMEGEGEGGIPIFQTVTETFLSFWIFSS